MPSAANFIQNRKTANGITERRIRSIMKYFVDCYLIMLSSKNTYNKEYVATSTSYHFEDFLKMDLVDKYLIPNKHLLAERNSPLEDITFHYETVQRFLDISDGKEKSDKIDVFINKLGLTDVWSQSDEYVYLAVECKRVRRISDCQKYLLDTQNFCKRKYKYFRLPFEGQVAFIEDHNVQHETVMSEINKKLEMSTVIKTSAFLSFLPIHPEFQGSYISSHIKSHNSSEYFKIYHLLFDYSKVVT